MKKLAIFMCVLLCTDMPTYTISQRRTIFGVTLTGICAAAIYGLVKKFRTPKKFKPNKKNLHIHIFEPAQLITRDKKSITGKTFDQVVHTMHTKKRLRRKTNLLITNQYKENHKIVKIHSDFKKLAKYDTFFVASRGYAKSNVPVIGDYLELTRDAGSIIEGHMLIKDNLIHNAPCVTFDYPDDPLYFNFGQNLDLSCLQTIWKYATHKKNNVSIVGVGDCRGGKALLSFATTRPPALKALVLMSPFVSDMDLINQIAKNHIRWLPWSDRILFNFFKFYFPSFDPNQDTLLEKIHMVDPALPIFIGHRKNDFLVSDKSIRQLLTILREIGNKDLYLLIVSDTNATHSRISPIPELQYAINAFLAAYNLPHDSCLADKGQLLLEQAKSTAQNF